ncbi:hypothetical protein BDY21DRAFT_353683 [Lineolata rhizophorae]|uniref:Uncharacterized protein n=1 Tax=Lineolata rhizophorae TaxID=578093 RepID=A0A6A6NRZ6_9PEZI|nr:hypothetical protein BDY21DRAFT_353683 [Lineolata rhizophorae]
MTSSLPLCLAAPWCPLIPPCCSMLFYGVYICSSTRLLDASSSPWPSSSLAGRSHNPLTDRSIGYSVYIGTHLHSPGTASAPIHPWLCSTRLFGPEVGRGKTFPFMRRLPPRSPQDINPPPCPFM